ncbi:efflux RND transporter permease subunit [Bdellovibrio sp. HCB117]|uniref:efflux RND transporter permease subunit n=1 Tax=Bdellovibrio sp. HCB117 TaxID=3394359 RepID=UPI0039B3F321
MSLPKISISRPIFTACVTIAIIVVGWASFKSMSVDLFPDVSIPVVTVQTTYPGAGPSEIETLVSRPIEEEVSTISGIKRLTSKSLEGVSQVIVEFNSSVDVKYAEQQVRDKVNIAKPKLPDDAEDSVIKKFDPSDTPILMVSLTANNLNDAQLFDIADQFIKPRLEQVNNVGAIEIFGGREREIHVILDRNKLRAREISVSQVAGQVGASGENIPSGKVEQQGGKELVFRGLGEFQSVPEISDTLVNLYGNEVPTRVADLGKVVDTMQDEKSRAYLNGEKALFLQVYRQSGSNTVRVADDVIKQLDRIGPELAKLDGAPKVQVVTNGSIKIKDNIYDVNETIIIGIVLTIITVFFFLGSARSTLITALSLPISLIGAFMIMKVAGFSINIVSMLALTLAVGLLIDDAIVVIENIYRRMELGEDSLTAAEKGTTEIQMAVMAITLVVIAVFVPVGTMSGTIGQFLKQFGMTVVFSMAISWFVAMTIIPMLTAYFGGAGHGAGHSPQDHNTLYGKTLGRLVRGFDRFQGWLENVYEKLLRVTLRHPLMTIGATFMVFVLSIYTVTKVPGAFITDDDSGEFAVTLEMEPGTSLDGMNKVADEVDNILRANPEVNYTAKIVGSLYGESNKSQFYVRMKDGKERGELTTEEFRDKIRKQLAGFTNANPVVKQYDASGGMGDQPFVLNIISADPKELEASATKVLATMKADPRFKDVDSNFRPGKPEMQVHVKPGAAKLYGINTKTMGGELRAQVEGLTPAKFREKGREYEVRVRLLPEQRDIKQAFNQVYVPNVNGKLVKLSDVATGDLATGPASIERQDRGRYIQVTAGLAPGVGLSDAVNDVVKSMTTGPNAFPPSVRYTFGGDAENMQELMTSTVLALGFAIMFIYLILSSLYESFITPITIMVALPLALCGAFLGLFLMSETLTIFAIFGFFMLIGVAGKNGILLVDYTNQMMAQGKSRAEALVEAGKTRLRPILMTSFALIAGTLPVAIGMNEASKTRTAMGVAIIGGMISSTILTLIVVPAVFTYVDRFRIWANNLGSRFTTHMKKEKADRHVEVKVGSESKGSVESNEVGLSEG